MNKKILILSAVLLLVLVLLLSGCTSITGEAKGAGVAQCNDKKDNDLDGQIDLNDPGCSSRKDTSELNPNIQCDDGIDNDGDGKIDMQDAGCSSPTDNDEVNCGDTVCSAGETQVNCPQDCGYPNPDSCNDTDGGFVATLQGTVSGYLSGQSYSYTDFCIGNLTLMEYYCSGNYKTNSTTTCITNTTTVCSNGACI